MEAPPRAGSRTRDGVTLDGVPIDEHCDRERLSISARLALVREVCAAVQYAHQRLVVHRDIKPANVMVTARGTPKLLDFGIARLLSTEADAPTDATATVDRMFTPEYASPEQVSGRPVTTATDVYQLGVLLYQLLTGRRPYRVTHALPHELAAAICEQEPQRPSAAITRVDAERSADALSRTREGSPDRLRRRLRGDIDAIVLKALRKEPDRRYVSAEQFSEEIQKHLSGLPVAARSGSRTYRTRRFLWRHRLSAAAVGAVFAALTAGLVIALWQARAAADQRSRAERLLYAAHMNLAGQSWNIADVARTVELLHGHIPVAGQEDRRGWERYHLWKMTHSERRTFPGAVAPIAISPDGRTLATGAESDHAVLLWDLETGQRLAVFSGHTDAVGGLDFSADGTWLASASDDKTARIWRVATSAQSALLTGHQAPVLSVKFFPISSRLVTASVDGSARVWDESGREIAILSGHSGDRHAVAVSRDETLIATSVKDGSVRLWSGRTFRLLDTLHDRRPGPITSVTFSPDARYLVTTGESFGGLAAWDLRTKTLLPAMTYVTSQFTSSFSPDGRLLATAGHDRMVILWDMQKQARVGTIRAHGTAVDAVCFSPDGRRLVSAGRDGVTRLWDVDVQQGPAVLSPGAASLAFSPDGSRLAIGTRTGLGLVDVASAQLVASLPLPAETAAVAFAPHGQHIAVLDAAATVHIRDAGSQAEIVTLPGRKPFRGFFQGRAIAFSANGRYLAAAEGDASIRVWDTTNWKQVAVLSGQEIFVAAVAFSPDSRFVAAVGASPTPQIWDLTGERPPLVLRQPTGGFWIGFTPDGTGVVTTGFDGIVRFWDASNGREVDRIVRGGDLGPAAFTLDWRRMVVGGLGDPSLAMFDLTTGELVLTLPGQTAPISGLAVSPEAARQSRRPAPTA